MKAKICAYCSNPFDQAAGSRKRICCSRACAAQYSHKARGGNPWTAEEVEWLERRVGAVPFYELVKKYHSYCRRNGLPSRTDLAVQLKIKRIVKAEKVTRKCVYDNWTVKELAMQLGISEDRVRRWCSRGLPRRTASGSRLSAIRRSDLKQWMLDNPERCSDIEAYLLEAVLDDAKAVAQIKETPPALTGFPKAVYCLDTGKTYPSVRAAARDVFISRHALQGSLRRGGRSAGYRWRWVS